MKQFSKISAIIILLGGFATALVAQPVGNGPQRQQDQNAQFDRPCMNLPDLTDAQKEKIEDIRFNTMKQVQPMKNQLMEKRAHLRTLRTAEKADLVAINKQIDEIYALEASIRKIQAASHQGVRFVLTDKQRVLFDKQSCRGMGGNGQGFGPGNGRCRGGRGAGAGYGYGFGNPNGCPFNN